MIGEVMNFIMPLSFDFVSDGKKNGSTDSAHTYTAWTPWGSSKLVLLTLTVVSTPDLQATLDQYFRISIPLSVEGEDRVADNGDAFVELRFGDDQWWSEADDVAMCGLGNKPVVFHGHAQVPSG